VADVQAFLSNSSTGKASSPRAGANATAVRADKATAARMMTHPEAVAAVTQEQYRLGLTKIFFQVLIYCAV
jgi:hypothetical protein